MAHGEQTEDIHCEGALRKTGLDQDNHSVHGRILFPYLAAVVTGNIVITQLVVVFKINVPLTRLNPRWVCPTWWRVHMACHNEQRQSGSHSLYSKVRPSVLLNFVLTDGEGVSPYSSFSVLGVRC